LPKRGKGRKKKRRVYDYKVKGAPPERRRGGDGKRTLYLLATWGFRICSLSNLSSGEKRERKKEKEALAFLLEGEGKGEMSRSTSTAPARRKKKGEAASYKKSGCANKAAGAHPSICRC